MLNHVRDTICLYFNHTLFSARKQMWHVNQLCGRIWREWTGTSCTSRSWLESLQRGSLWSIKQKRRGRFGNGNIMPCFAGQLQNPKVSSIIKTLQLNLCFSKFWSLCIWLLLLLWTELQIELVIRLVMNKYPRGVEELSLVLKYIFYLLVDLSVGINECFL